MCIIIWIYNKICIYLYSYVIKLHSLAWQGLGIPTTAISEQRTQYFWGQEDGYPSISKLVTWTCLWELLALNPHWKAQEARVWYQWMMAVAIAMLTHKEKETCSQTCASFLATALPLLSTLLFPPNSHCNHDEKEWVSIMPPLLALTSVAHYF